MPIAYEFNPELVLISAGFDAAKGDPLGGYKVGNSLILLILFLDFNVHGFNVIVISFAVWNDKKIKCSAHASSLFHDDVSALVTRRRKSYGCFGRRGVFFECISVLK